jgi:rhamnosyl/mannosyltransferase
VNVNLFSPYPPVRSGIVTYTENLTSAFQGEDLSVNRVNHQFWGRYLPRSWGVPTGKLQKRWFNAVSAVSTAIFYRKPPDHADSIHHFQLSGGQHNYVILKDFHALRGRRVVTVHDRTFRVHRLGHCYDPDEQLRVLRSADLVITHTHELKHALAAVGVHARWVPHGVRVDRFDIPMEEAKQRIGIREPIVAHVGFLFGYKGVHNLVRAASRIPAKLLVVGSDPDDGYLKSMAAQLAPGKVIFRPYVSEDEYPYYLAAADVVAMPRLKSDGECSGVMVQAMAAGRAIVASDLGCFREYVGPERAELVPPDDVEALLAGILRLLSSEGLRRRCGDACRRYAREHLGWEQVARRHVELYREILEPDRSSEERDTGT